MPPPNRIPNKCHVNLPRFAWDAEKDGKVGICL
jgi:hypothetical protein